MLDVIFNDNDRRAAQLVLAALRRSVGRDSARLHASDAFDERPAIAVLVGDVACSDLETLLGAGRKLIVFGPLPDSLRSQSRTVSELPDDPPVPAPIHCFSESRLTVRYRAGSPLGRSGWRRPFWRYDFADEWNNLGYGAITRDQSMWAVGPPTAVSPAEEIAAIVNTDEQHLGSYAALFDRDDHSILWMNRAAGPLDSFEWRIVETFISEYRHEDLLCVPVISEIPAGHDAAIVARLDCDEDIQSADALASVYDEMSVPLSLAILTKILPADGPPPLLRRVARKTGAVQSHSVSHDAYWGGSYEAALIEARSSAEMIARNIGARPRYAVSPFHQTPDFALAALEAEGYAGCVGGSISGDPTFTLARGGPVVDREPDFVGATMQCMLHGDCMLDGDDPLGVYKTAFDLAHETRSLFGYLDHPFSGRYQYGWPDEIRRADAHRSLIAHIRTRARQPLFLSVGDAMDFLRQRARLRLTAVAGGFRARCGETTVSPHGLTVEYRGRRFDVSDGDVLQ